MDAVRDGWTLVAITGVIAVTCIVTVAVASFLRGRNIITALISGLAVPAAILGLAFWTSSRPNPHHYPDYPGMLVVAQLFVGLVATPICLITSTITLVAKHRLARRRSKGGVP